MIFIGICTVAVLFGPQNGALTERFVREAWDEATLKKYTHLYVVGFAIDPKAREFIEKAGKIGTPATYLTATMDLQMGRAAAVGACIGVLSGTGTLEGLGPLADAIISSVAELLPSA